MPPRRNKVRGNLSRNGARFHATRIPCELKKLAPLCPRHPRTNPRIFPLHLPIPHPYFSRALARRTCAHTCARTTTGRCCAHTAGRGTHDPRSRVTGRRASHVPFAVSTSACSSSSPCRADSRKAARRESGDRGGQKTAKGSLPGDALLPPPA